MKVSQGGKKSTHIALPKDLVGGVLRAAPRVALEATVAAGLTGLTGLARLARLTVGAATAAAAAAAAACTTTATLAAGSAGGALGARCTGLLRLARAGSRGRGLLLRLGLLCLHVCRACNAKGGVRNAR